MATREIPVYPQLRAFSERVVLDGTPIILEGRFNGRMDRWVIDFKDEDGEDLLVGLPLVPDWGLNASFAGRIERMPRGEFFVLDTTGRQRPADLDNFGKDVKLFYLEAA